MLLCKYTTDKTHLGTLKRNTVRKTNITNNVQVININMNGAGKKWQKPAKKTTNWVTATQFAFDGEINATRYIKKLQIQNKRSQASQVGN